MSGSAPPACSGSPRVSAPSPSPHPNTPSRAPLVVSVLLLGQGPPLHPGGFPGAASTLPDPSPISRPAADSGERPGKAAPSPPRFRALCSVAAGSQKPLSTQPSPQDPAQTHAQPPVSGCRGMSSLRRAEAAAGPPRSGPETGRAPSSGPLGRKPTAWEWRVSRADSASHHWDRHSVPVVINNPRPCSVFYETLCLPFNELRVTNQKVTPRKWGDLAGGKESEGQGRRGGSDALTRAEPALGRADDGGSAWGSFAEG